MCSNIHFAKARRVFASGLLLIAAVTAFAHPPTQQRMTTTRLSNDPLYAQQWALGDAGTALRIRGAWRLSTGAGVTVAVLDTGTTAHREISAQRLPGFDFISDPAEARDGDGRDRFPDDAGDWHEMWDCPSRQLARPSQWSGTRAIGVIAATTHNSAGMAGVAYDADVVPVRVRGRCGVADNDLVDAIAWASGDLVPDVPANPHPATVLLVGSSAAGACPQRVQHAINSARQRGAVMIVASGDGGQDSSAYYPGNCLGVMTVAAHDLDGHIAAFSNVGSAVSLSAPGQSILSTANDGVRDPRWPIYATSSSTLLAAAHVAGVVALMQSVADPALSPAELEHIIQATAHPLPHPCPAGCGAGTVDADAAVRAAQLSRTGL